MAQILTQRCNRCYAEFSSVGWIHNNAGQFVHGCPDGNLGGVGDFEGPDVPVVTDKELAMYMAKSNLDAWIRRGFSVEMTEDPSITPKFIPLLLGSSDKMFGAIPSPPSPQDADTLITYEDAFRSVLAARGSLCRAGSTSVGPVAEGGKRQATEGQSSPGAGTVTLQPIPIDTLRRKVSGGVPEIYEGEGAANGANAGKDGGPDEADSGPNESEAAGGSGKNAGSAGGGQGTGGAGVSVAGTQEAVPGQSFNVDAAPRYQALSFLGVQESVSTAGTIPPLTRCPTCNGVVQFRFWEQPLLLNDAEGAVEVAVIYHCTQCNRDDLYGSPIGSNGSTHRTAMVHPHLGTCWPDAQYRPDRFRSPSKAILLAPRPAEELELVED